MVWNWAGLRVNPEISPLGARSNYRFLTPPFGVVSLGHLPRSNLNTPGRDELGINKEWSEGADPGGSQGQSWDFAFSPFSGDRSLLPPVGWDLERSFR